MKKKTNKLLLSLLLLIMSVIMIGCGAKTEDLEKTPKVTEEEEIDNELVNEKEEEKEVIPLATGEWPPFVSETMEGNGFFGEIIKEVFNVMGKSYKFDFYQWERCETTVQSGEAFAAFPYAYTDERAEKYLYSDQIASSDTKFFYYKGNTDNSGLTFDTLADLKDYMVGGVTGYFYEADFNKSGLKVEWSSTEEELLKKLQSGRIQLAPFSELAGWQMINNTFSNEKEKFGIINKPLNDVEAAKMHLIVSKTYPNSEELLKQFNAGLKTIKENGVFNKIATKYNYTE